MDKYNLTIDDLRVFTKVIDGYLDNDKVVYTGHDYDEHEDGTPIILKCAEQSVFDITFLSYVIIALMSSGLVKSVNFGLSPGRVALEFYNIHNNYCVQTVYGGGDSLGIRLFNAVVSYGIIQYGKPDEWVVKNDQ